jgi:hypothetical protein
MHVEWVLTNLCWFWMQVHDQIAWSLPSLIPGLLARPSTPFSAKSREWPLSPNFPQLYIIEPSSGFNKGLRSASQSATSKCVASLALVSWPRQRPVRAWAKRGCEWVWEWTLTLSSELQFWELESWWTPKSLESNCKGQNTSHWNFLLIMGKLLKHRCLKWAHMTHLDIWNTSYG